MSRKVLYSAAAVFLVLSVTVSIDALAQQPQSRKATASNVVGQAGKAVNLGLSVNWCDRNLGAERPEQVGHYFGYGDISGEAVWQANGEYQQQDIYGTDYDPAYVYWSEGWRMPTSSEIQELVTRCFWRWGKQNGVEGFIVTGRGGASIFLPCSGHMMDAQIYYAESRGYYWSGMVSSRNENFAQALFFYKGNKMIKDYRNFYGFVIRPVKD